MIKLEGVILHWEKRVFSTNFDALFNNLLRKIKNFKNYFPTPNISFLTEVCFNLSLIGNAQLPFKIQLKNCPLPSLSLFAKKLTIK